MTEYRGDAFRVARLSFGLFLYAVGMVLMLHANLGVSPWNVFHLGVAKHLKVSIGTAIAVTSGTIVAVSVIMREHVGLATVCNMFFVGFFVDFIIWAGWVPVRETMLSGVVMLVCGLFVIAVATFFYMGAGYGAGPRDSLMVVLTKRTGRSAGLCRFCLEGAALSAGWLLGGQVGVGTVISVVGIGFAVQSVFTLLRFDVKKIDQESFGKTFARFRAWAWR